MNVFSTAHGRGQNSFHFVWKPKYAYSILIGSVKVVCEEVLRQVAAEHGYVIHAMEVMADHVHVFLSFKPSVCVSDVFQKLKGASAHQLFKRFPHLRKQYWGGHLWSRGKFWRSIGSTTDRAVKHYIECSQGSWQHIEPQTIELDPKQTKITKYLRREYPTL